MATATSLDTSPLVLELSNVSKRRTQGGITFELHIPKLCLHQGQFVAVVGDSGCGKSTLLDILALVSRPTTCEQFDYFEARQTKTTPQTDIKKLWEQEDEYRLAALRRSCLGYVLQTGGLLPFLTVFQNIQLPSKILGLCNDAETKELAQRIGVDGILEKKPQYLSGGQRQRVAILRALLHHPNIILADEPTAAVDKKRAYSIVNEFSLLAKEKGTTVVMVSHDRELVTPFANVTYTFEVMEISNTFARSTCQQLI